MTKPNTDTLDPITNDDSLADQPREDVDPIPDRVPSELKPKRKRRPSMKRKIRGEG